MISESSHVENGIAPAGARNHLAYDGLVMLLRRTALAALIGNVLIVLTGGGVRLSGSGLGCPTWPRCTEDAYTPFGAMDVHKAIEFGNRMLGWVLGVIAVAVLVAAWRQRPVRRDLRRLALGGLFGILLQGGIGGVTVRTGLNPWIVGAHFLISMGLIALSYALWRRTDAGPAEAVHPRLRVLGWTVVTASALALTIGVLVTGSGPHSGDETAGRTGFDPELISQLHADAVFLLLGVTIAGWLVLRAVGAAAPSRATLTLLAVILGQGTIGFVQYFTGLPEVLVAAHMAGACLLWIAALAVLWSTGFGARTGDPTAAGSAPSGQAGHDAVDLVTVR